MSAIFLFKLLLAHVIADFFLQFDKLCQAKHKAGREAFIAQAVHALIHALCAYLLLADWCGWIVPLVIFVTHFIIDTLKIKWDGSGTPGFLTDQLAHVTVIVMLWWTLQADHAQVTGWLTDVLNSKQLWAVLIGYLIVLKPASILIGTFIRGWIPSNNMQAQGMPRAGAWIGYIERVLIVTFVITGNIEAVGFLLAAKSIFRFGDLNKAREIKITEYVLLGTLASFSLALLVAFALKYYLNL